MTKQFDPTKPVQTRDGRKARIICTDRKSDKYPIIALVDNGYAGEEYSSFTKNGVFNVDSDIPESDLINIPEKRECWINHFAPTVTDGLGLICGPFSSPSEAEYNKEYHAERGRVRTACIHHVWEE